MAGRVVLACFLALVASPSAFGFQLTSSPMALQKSAAAVSGLRTQHPRAMMPARRPGPIVMQTAEDATAAKKSKSEILSGISKPLADSWDTSAEKVFDTFE
eukprot:3245509-Rhodomonas_salina.2